jgi:hypothetical protein
VAGDNPKINKEEEDKFKFISNVFLRYHFTKIVLESKFLRSLFLKM